MVDPVEGFAEVNQASWLGMIFVQVLVDKVKHMNKIVFNRTAWQATELVKVNVGAYEGPDPLDEEPFQSLTEEGGEAKISELILRLGDGNLIDGKVILFLEGFWPGMGGNCFSVNSCHRGS